MSDRTTQCQTVLSLLREHGTISAHDLTYRHGITRLAARVWDLKREGHVIETIRGGKLADGTTQMASYRLVVPVKPVQVALFDEVRA